MGKSSCCIAVELLPVVGLPVIGLQDFVLCECDTCILRSNKCHLSLQLHPFLLFVFLLCSCNEKEKNECMKKGNDAIRAIPLHVREKTLHTISWLKGMRTS